eukprot:4690992-Alexandrium_andersonii.AAC.1
MRDSGEARVCRSMMFMRASGAVALPECAGRMIRARRCIVQTCHLPEGILAHPETQPPNPVPPRANLDYKCAGLRLRGSAPGMHAWRASVSYTHLTLPTICSV